MGSDHLKSMKTDICDRQVCTLHHGDYSDTMLILILISICCFADCEYGGFIGYGNNATVTKCEVVHLPVESVLSAFRETSYEEFKLKKQYINCYQFEIFVIKAAEKQRK